MTAPFLPSQRDLQPLDVRRLCRAGELRRLLRGVYVDAEEPDTIALRARAVALVAQGRAAVGACAGWVHGIVADPVGVLEFGRAASPVRVGALEVAGLEETALTLTRRLAAPAALGVLDAALRRGANHRALLDRAPSALVAAADGRALDHDESAVRWAWLQSGLATPRLGVMVPLVGGPVRVPIGLADRRFGAGPQPLDVPGWRVVSLRPDRLLTQSDLGAAHLRLSFHRYLLDLVELIEQQDTARKSARQAAQKDAAS